MIDNQPGYGKTKFTCPVCGALAQMNWVYGQQHKEFPSHRIAQAKCFACGDVSVWRSNLSPEQQMFSDLASRGAVVQTEGTMIYPRQTTAPLPSSDLPVSCKRDFEEAREILEVSPRGAAALLRLVIQKLCINFGEPGKNINEDIGSLVKKGKLNAQIQRALDVVRIVGNSSVHPGEIQVEDNVDLVRKLFVLVNYIVDEMITAPNLRNALFDDLPDGPKEGIAKRDGPKP